MFHKKIVELLTLRTAIKTMTMYWWLQAGMAAYSLFQGAQASSANKAAGQAAREAAYANAADLLHYTGLNNDLIMGAAERNAAAIMTIGFANAEAVERATARNLWLYGIQAEEEVRRHVISEKMKAGEIRAVAGSSGLMVNEGTPAAYLASQVHEGITQREYMIFKHEQTMIAMAEEGADRAGIYRLTASENAAVTMSNAHAQIGVSMNNAIRESEAMKRGGINAQSSYNAQASQALWSGIGGAISSGYQAYTGYQAANPSTQAFNAPPTVASSTPPASITAPNYAGYPGIYANSTQFTGKLPSWYGNP